MVAKGFIYKWNFRHCVGAFSDKHITTKLKSVSYYYNYKSFHLLVLLGLIDIDCKFIYVDMGVSGANSDAGVFLNTLLRAVLDC